MKSFFGGAQGEQGYFLGIRYRPGSFLDHLVETYAGPHDYLSAPLFYDQNGNSLGRPVMFDAVSAGYIALATPFAAASAIPNYAYGAVR